jgi:hypothetical protein
MAQGKPCSPTCSAFKCAKNSAFYRRDAVWCRWTEELCNVANCQYSMCMKRRLLPQGICGETVRRKTVDRNPEDFIDEPVRLKGKAFRKLGERELY